MRYFVILCLILVGYIEMLPMSTTRSPINRIENTTKSTYDTYDEYDEKFYKDYYNEDYEEEIEKLQEKEIIIPATSTTIKSVVNKTTINNKSLLPKYFPSTASKSSIKPTSATIKALLPDLRGSNKSVVMVNKKSKASTKATPTQTTLKRIHITSNGSDDYDFSDYYDYYDDDYLLKYQQNSDNPKVEAAEAKKTEIKPEGSTKKIRVTTTAKTTVEASTKATFDYDYNEYYDYDESDLKSSTPSLKLNKKTDLAMTTRSSTAPKFRPATTTINSDLLEKSTKKNNEYYEYYEDDYYEDMNDYYNEDYHYYDELEKLQKQPSTTTVANLVSEKVHTGIKADEKKPLDIDYYDEKNYDYYDESNYDDSAYDDYLDEDGKAEIEITKSADIAATKPSLTTPEESVKASKKIILVPQSPDDLLMKSKIPTRKTTPRVTKPTTTLEIKKKDEDAFYYNDNEYMIPNSIEEETSTKAGPNLNMTLLKGDLKLKELIKSPALLAGIFGGLLLGLVTALLLLIFIIYRVRQRKYSSALRYDLDTKLRNEKYHEAKERKRAKKSNRGKKLRSEKNISIDANDNNLNTQNLLSSSQLSTPSNNASSSTTSNTGLINGQTLMTNSRLLKYANATNTNSLRIVSSVLSTNESDVSPSNHEGSFNYAYIKAPTKEFYA